eukprot:6457351-Amphidinium_carterae.1
MCIRDRFYSSSQFKATGMLASTCQPMPLEEYLNSLCLEDVSATEPAKKKPKKTTGVGAEKPLWVQLLLDDTRESAPSPQASVPVVSAQTSMVDQTSGMHDNALGGCMSAH